MSSQSLDWFLTFSTELHGFSLNTLYRRCDDFLGGDLTPFEGNAPRTAGEFEEKVVLTNHRSLHARQQIQPCVLLIKDTADNVRLSLDPSHTFAYTKRTPG